MFTSMADSLRIRFDGNRHREDAIKQAAQFYDCNKSDAASRACEDVVKIISAAEQVLQRKDLTLEQRQEIADSLSTGATTFDIDLRITQDKK